jgi:TolB-like protein
LTDRSKAVFVSYASDDQAAAQRLCDGLRGAAIETWFDVSELRGGDAWDANIRRQIRDCALFVPIISARTESRGEGYFRLEWRLAVERSFHFADDQAFLMPVVIDATAQPHARVPERFRERQWTSLPGGNPTPQFIANVRKRLAGATVPAAPADVAAAPAARRGPARILITALAVGLLLAAGLAAWLHRSAGSSTSAGVGSALDRKSIAVLPFENLTGHTDDAYLADGLQEEILNALARVRDLKVISRTSVAEFRGAARNIREIGNRLGVGTVLEGSVRRDANALRLTFQLISVKDDAHLLAANYDRDLAHILGLQSEVAHKVAEALTATLSQVERGELDHLGTNNGDAYLSYLKAVALFQRWDWGDAATVTEPAQLLEGAIRLDPEFADAYALQSRIYSVLYFRNLRPEYGARARAAYESALAIDPGLIEARLARGFYELYVTRNLDRASADLEAVASMRPSSPSALHALGLVLRRRGRSSEAVPYFQRAWDLDPLNHSYDPMLLTTYTGLRRFPELLEWARLHEARFPDNPAPQLVRARVQALSTHSLEPLRALLQRTDLDSDTRRSIAAQIATAEGRYQEAIALWESRGDIDAQTRLETTAFLYRAAGDSAAAEQRFRAVEHDLSAALQTTVPDRDELIKDLALVQSALEEHESALKTIEEARALLPESLDHVNGPQVSFVRSVVLARAGHTTEAHAEVERLLHVPFGSPLIPWGDPSPVYLLLKNDAHFDELLNRPPRL